MITGKRCFTFLALTFVMGLFIMCSSQQIIEETLNMEDKIAALITSGEFTRATEMMSEYIDGGAGSQEMRQQYRFEIERLRRIRADFTKTREEVLEFIRKYYPEVTDADMSRWEEARSLEVMVIDGEKWYFARAARNLFRIDAEMREIWAGLHPDEELTSGSGAKLDLDEHNAQVIKAAQETSGIFVEPRRLHITQSIEVPADEVPAGELIRCWIPYPRFIEDRQVDITLIQTRPARHVLAPPDALQRTVYLEKAAMAGETTRFSVEYEFTSHGVFQAIDPKMVKPLEELVSLEPYLREEAPHILFSPELKALSQDIVGDETNPYLIARKLFAWVDNNTPWASAREYSTIPNIPEYARVNHHGDCGIQTLFFITLCRINGIPARWQSGWELQPPDDSMHDWGMIYFEPYGWVPMDVTYGLRKSDDPNLHWFYLSGMDSYRIIFNDAISQPFTPAKQHFRSETVDSQRGEVEWSGGNLYFDQWDWNFEWEIVDLKN